MRTLVAGFGNEMRGDDGFGVAVVRSLEQQRQGVTDGALEIMEVGIAGVTLVQELMRRYDRVIVVDAMTRGAPPGTLYVHRVESLPAVTGIDPHLTVPGRALATAQALGVLPGEVFLVGCEPQSVDDLSFTLSTVVATAVPAAIEAIERLARPAESADCDESSADATAPGRGDA